MAQTGGPSFSADMKMAGKGVSSTGKLYSSGDKVRMEIKAQAAKAGPMGNMIMISDSTKKLAYMLMPEQKMYMEMSTANAEKKGPSYRSYNPLNPCEGLPNTKCTKVGTEMMNGELCTKWQFVSTGNGPNLTTWISQKTNIPVKTVTADGSTMELTNIQTGPQSASLFQVPAGYQKFDMGNMMKGLGGMRPPAE